MKIHETYRGSRLPMSALLCLYLPHAGLMRDDAQIIVFASFLQLTII